MRLLGDIGGTYARFALQTRRGRYREVERYEVAAFPGIADAIRTYLRGRRVRDAVLAVATPVEGDEIRFTNSPWSFSRSRLQAELGLERLAVLNDFVAQALGVAHLDPAELEPIGPGSAAPERPAVVLGPGTGLGCAVLTRTGRHPRPLASEAGHMSFAPEDEVQQALLAELAGHYPHVSWERVVSGPGLVTTARALAAIAGERLELERPHEVVGRAREGSCRHCRRAVDLFSAALGAFAGNLALAVLARGGVFLVGSLLTRLGEAFDTELFRTRFEAKGRLSELLAEIPTYRVSHEETGLLGVSWFAFR